MSAVRRRTRTLLTFAPVCLVGSFYAASAIVVTVAFSRTWALRLTSKLGKRIHVRIVSPRLNEGMRAFLCRIGVSLALWSLSLFPFCRRCRSRMRRMGSPMPSLFGRCVSVSGLQSAKELNGRFGRLASFDREKKRAGVEFGPGCIKSIRTCNLSFPARCHLCNAEVHDLSGCDCQVATKIEHWPCKGCDRTLPSSYFSSREDPDICSYCDAKHTEKPKGVRWG